MENLLVPHLEEEKDRVIIFLAAVAAGSGIILPFINNLPGNPMKMAGMAMAMAGDRQAAQAMGGSWPGVQA